MHGRTTRASPAPTTSSKPSIDRGIPTGEKLWDMGDQYDYVAILDYNLPQGPITTGAKGVRRSSTSPDTSRGGGIFLHVDNGNKTAGCIAVKKKVMRNLMKWLDPKKDPVIVIRVT